MSDTAHNNCEPRDLVIGTRGSALALWQARTVAAAIEAAVEAGFHAGNLIKAVAPAIKGGGGGKPAMAQAGGKDAAGIPAAMAKVIEILGA